MILLCLLQAMAQEAAHLEIGRKIEIRIIFDFILVKYLQ